MIELEAMLIRIKKICKEKDISYRELSGMTGISLSTLSKIMAGITKDPTIMSISKIAQALDVTLDYLIYGEKNQKKTITPYDLLNEAGQFKAQEYIMDLLENAKYVRQIELIATPGSEKALSGDVINAIVKAFNASDKQGEE